MKIAFTGQMRSGKDAAAEYVVATHGGKIHKFADGVYRIHDHAIAPGATVSSTMEVAHAVMDPVLTVEEQSRGSEVWSYLQEFLEVWFGPPETPNTACVHRQEGQKNRYLLQHLGTEWARYNIAQDIWVRAFCKGLEKTAPDENIYCTDLRFHNECEILHQNGFVVIRVERPEAARLAAGATNISHLSEVNIPHLDVDFTIHNRGSLLEYHSKLDLLINPAGIQRLNAERTLHGSNR